MATLSALNPTIIDVAKRLDPDGNIAAIAEVVSESNPILMDAVAIEGNLPTGNRSTQRTGLPTATWRMLNQGVPNSKSTTVQVDDTCGMLEVYAEVDKKLADLNGNSAAFMASEDMAFLESMSQEMAEKTIYGDSATAPEEFVGLAPRYAATSADQTNSGYNVILNGGSGADNCSVWFVTWGPSATHLIYPKGSMAGFQRSFKGQETLQDSSGNQYEGYRTHYSWDIGLTVRDWRSNCRIANIDVSGLASAGDNIFNSLIIGKNRLRGPGGRVAMYCSRTFKDWLDIEVMKKSNVNLTIGEYAGMPTLQFQGVPVRVLDTLVENEALVS